MNGRDSQVLSDRGIRIAHHCSCCLLGVVFSARAERSNTHGEREPRKHTGIWVSDCIYHKRGGYWSIFTVDENGDQRKILDITSVKDGPPRFALDLLGQTDWSPDGSVFLFTCTPTRSEICLAPGDGSLVKRLTFDAGDVDNYAEWTPDGNEIVFSSYRKGSTDIYLARADGSDERPLVTGDRDEFAPSISPDGRALAYVERKPRGFRLHLAHLREGRVTEVFRTIEDAAFPSWAPSGSKLLFTRQRDERFADVYMTDGAGIRLQRLTRSPGMDYWPTWSPDEQMIAFTRDTDFDEEERHYLRSDLYLLTLSQGKVRNLTNDQSINLHPDWRPIQRVP